MEYTLTAKESYLIINFNGRLVAAYAEELRENVGLWLQQSANLVFDLEDMAYIDSSGLGCLVFALQKAQNQSGTVKLVALQARPKIIFDITKVNRVFEVFDTIELAEKSFK